jgi:uncharacterized protein YecE (DUF72 family)
VIRIGTSGWHYAHWKGPFYPEKLAASKMLEYYARHFDTVELNNTFYRLPVEGGLETGTGRGEVLRARGPAARVSGGAAAASQVRLRAAQSACRSRPTLPMCGCTVRAARAVYVYLDNDQTAYAVENARDLKELVG